MVFSSISGYLDPANWQQQPQTQHQTGRPNSGVVNHLFTPPQPPPLPPPPPHGTGGGIRPGSMADRARMANIPMPETALKCPRCDSANTKFCYFNNYSLTQPRHFCKTCRRYWTRGGALRNVPVGGGCRRNKRGKGSSNSNNNNSCSSKSPVSGDRSTGSTPISSGHDMLLGLNGVGGGNIPLPLRFMGGAPSLHHLSQEFASNAADISLNYGAMNPPLGQGTTNLGFHVGNPIAATSHITAGLAGSSGSGSFFPSITGGGFNNQLRFQQQQFPSFLGGGFDSSSSSGGGAGLLYPFEHQHHQASSGYGVGAGQIRPKLSSGLSGLQQSQLVKMEDNNNNQSNEGGINLGRQLNDHYWMNANTHTATNTAATNSWTDFSSFSSSSTSNPL